MSQQWDGGEMTDELAKILRETEGLKTWKGKAGYPSEERGIPQVYGVTPRDSEQKWPTGSEVFITTCDLSPLGSIAKAQAERLERLERVLRSSESVLSDFLDLQLSTLTSEQTHDLSKCRSDAIDARAQVRSALTEQGDDPNAQ